MAPPNPAAAGSTAAVPLTPINVQASQNPAHPQHAFSLGQLFATILLGLVAYQQEKTQGAAVFLEPETTAAYLQGLTSIWVQPAA